MIQRHENAGSFADHGHLGPTADMMCQMYLECSDGGADAPTRVEMGSAAHGFWLAACDRNVAERELRQRELSQRHPGQTYGPSPCSQAMYYGAEVHLNSDLEPGTMRFYKGDELVGEITGWTA